MEGGRTLGEQVVHSAPVWLVVDHLSVGRGHHACRDHKRGLVDCDVGGESLFVVNSAK